MAEIDSSIGQPSQVTVKTAFTVCFVVLAVAALALIIIRAEVPLILTGIAALLAVALDHLVTLAGKVRIKKRGPAIAVVLSTLLILMAVVGLLVIPPAIAQGQELATQAPQLVKDLRASPFFQSIESRFHIEKQIKEEQQTHGAALATGALHPLLLAVSGFFTLLGAMLTITFLTVFMLIFGPDMVHWMLGQATPERRTRYERVVSKVYDATGGYLGGLTMICSINATLTTTILAILGVPFFLPLGIISGFSSMIPYAGPIIVGGLITLVTLATAGAWKALAVFIYFILYGQLEGNVLAPLVFRRTVHVNPLLTLFAVVFFGEMAGIIGAVLAVPLIATGQIIVRELLLIRREKLGPSIPVP